MGILFCVIHCTPGPGCSNVGQHYPPDKSLSSGQRNKYIGFHNTYPLDSDLSGGQSYPTFEQPGPEVPVYIYCNKLPVANQGDCFTSCENIISCTQTLLLSPAFPGIYPVLIMCSLREVVPLKNRLFVTGTGNHRRPLFTFTCNPWSTVLKLQVTGNIMYYRQLLL